MADLSVGGQAVIEGVMMRSKERVATAVRTPSGEILIKTEPFIPLARRYKILNTPVVRGAVAFVEMLFLGIRTLNFSAEVAIQEAEKEEAAREGREYTPAKKKKRNAFLLMGTAVFAMAMGIGIFFYLPLAAAEGVSNLFGFNRDAVGFNLVAGAVRLVLFLGYVWAISLFGEFRRVFEYHGAEHKSIYTYEMGQELTPERASLFTRFHPRCGTSFILIVALLAMLVYSISDSIYAIVVGHAPALGARFGVHFSLLPIVAGASYELLKLSGRTRDNAVTRILIAPGLWLQRITTKEPSFEQLEVAIAALEASLGVTDSKLTCRRTPVS
jgi:uncharacterized protein YqhQ